MLGSVYYTNCEQNRCVKIPSTMVLCRPTTAYAPWFGVVLKTARLAVSMISILSKEVRPC